MNSLTERRPLTVLNGAVPQVVLDTLSHPDRLTPMLAGASCIRQQRDQWLLVVRRAQADVEVKAPRALLDQVFSLCDGTRTVNEILAQIAEQELRQEFTEFMAFLLEQGALIDANLACAHAVRYGFQFSPFGLAAPANVTHQLSTRFLWHTEGAPDQLPSNSVPVPATPLDVFFQNRTTQYTFDDTSISEDSLHQLLWSAAGVVNVRHPRSGPVMPQRTLASAGAMHLLTLLVALRREVGRYTPGVYRVEYPGERLIALHHLHGDMQALPLVFSKPWQLTFATGAIFVVADPAIGAMRYRNRSLQYLFMEAGAALHNVALSAHALGLGQATIGGYYEGPAATLCRLDKELVLGASIFGAQATPQQLADAARVPDIDFAWVNGESSLFSMGFHLARAKVNTEGDDRPHTWGRDTDPMLAMRKAVAEAIEREGYLQPRDIIEGTLAEVEGAVDPRASILYSPAQYDTPGFPYQRFDPAQRHAWAKGHNLGTDKPARVLAELVFSRERLMAQGHTSPGWLTQVTSSGCAAGLSLQDASARATREVIERDAFMRHWLSQSPGCTVPENQWPQAIRQRVLAMQAADCRVQIQKLNTPWLHVAMVGVQHEEKHFTTMSLAASHCFTQAVEGALDETEARVYAWLHGHSPTISLAEQVRTTEHHFELYGLKRYFHRADRVLFPKQPELTAHWPTALKTRTLDDMVRALAFAGLHPIVIDITPQKHFVDQGRTPLSVVKVLAPGLLPIAFGYAKEPRGLVSKVHPGAKVPHPFP